VDRAGDVFFTDVPNRRIHKIEHATGKASVWKEETGGADGMMFGPDGRLYACENRANRIVAYAPDGTTHVIAEDVTPNDLVVSAKGEVYFTDPSHKRIWHVDGKGSKRVVHEGLEFPNGLVLSPDQSLLLVADSRGGAVWSFQVAADGALANGQPFYRLETLDDGANPFPDGVTVDADGYLYVATRLGLQVCDQPGRVAAIIEKPHPGTLANAVFGGPNLDTLYVAAGDKVYRRVVRRKGVWPWQPVKPPQPRL
jgi:sugar lactone lactonase YvrE